LSNAGEQSPGSSVLATQRINMEEVVGKLLLKRKQSIATAESCTGGLLGHRITSVAGCSAYYAGGIIAYSNEIKILELGVDADCIEKYGAVSEPVAYAMAKNVREKFDTDYGLSTTGIAGPGGGTADKPVGLVYIGIASESETTVKRYLFTGSRDENKFLSSQMAMNDLRLQYLDR